MKKAELKEQIINKIKNVDYCEITKVYANGMGVGYDLIISLTTKNNERITLDAKAHRHSWADVGHNGDHQRQFMDYMGSCDVYRDEVREYWTEKTQDALNEYFGRFKKQELIEYLNELS